MLLYLLMVIALYFCIYFLLHSVGWRVVLSVFLTVVVLYFILVPRVSGICVEVEIPRRELVIPEERGFGELRSI